MSEKNKNEPQQVPQSAHVVDLRQQSSAAANQDQFVSAQGQVSTQAPEQPQMPQFQNQVHPPQQPYPPQQQYAMPPMPPFQEKQKSGKLTQFLLGCCIILLLVLIGLVGTGVYFIKQTATTLQEKGITDVGKFFDEHVGQVIKDAIQSAIENQKTEMSPELQKQLQDELNKAKKMQSQTQPSR